MLKTESHTPKVTHTTKSSYSTMTPLTSWKHWVLFQEILVRRTVRIFAILSLGAMSLSRPIQLHYEKRHYGGDHIFTYIRASDLHEWEETVEVNGLVMKWAFSKFGRFFVPLLEIQELIHLYRTNCNIGEMVMWTCLFNQRSDLALKLPILRTLKMSRLLDKETMRQDMFEQEIGP